MSKILLVDDEKLPMEYYIRAFRMNNYEVKQCFNPDSALELVEKKPIPFKAIILDIMMLPGEKYKNEDTDDGLKTGKLLYRDLRAHYPNIPIIILTNVSNPEIHLVPGETSDTLAIVQKIDYPPFELVALVKKMIDMLENLRET